MYIFCNNYVFSLSTVQFTLLNPVWLGHSCSPVDAHTVVVAPLHEKYSDISTIFCRDILLHAKVWIGGQVARRDHIYGKGANIIIKHISDID